MDSNHELTPCKGGTLTLMRRLVPTWYPVPDLHHATHWWVAHISYLRG